MNQIVEWGKNAVISDRIYHRGCIKLPDMSLPVDIMLMNIVSKDSRKIGQAYLVENEIGIYYKDVEWIVDIEYLDEVLDSSSNTNNDIDVVKYTKGVTITLMGYEKLEYKEKDSLEFAFLVKTILTKDPLDGIMRDLKINSII